jgi:biliverdin reductase
MHGQGAPLNQSKVRVGLVGTGYAAKLRAEALLDSQRATLVAIAGHIPQNTADFAQQYGTVSMSSWQELIEREDLDLIIICTVNQDHGKIVNAALIKGKHVIVEYPLALDVDVAEQLIALARAENKLLHVEHIELLGGWHQALKQNLAQLGDLFYVRYSTVNPQHPAPRKWTYQHHLFGFPLIAALSRLNRLTDLFGQVSTVSCDHSYWQTEPDYYKTCLCIAKLRFTSGLLAQVIYGKGEALWLAERKFEVHGEKGGLILDGDTGALVQGTQTTSMEVGTRRGLFTLDTNMVLDHLFDGTPLYTTPEQSLYTLKVASAAQKAASTGLTIVLTDL